MSIFKLQNQVVVDESLYQDDVRESYPAIAWHGKYNGDPEAAGYFTLDVDAINEGAPEGWETDKIQYGTDPSADFVDVFKTQALTCVPIGVRKRVIITDEHGNDHHYPWRTPKNKRVPGRFSSHYQVMVMVPGIEEVCVIGLRGQTKTTAWDNDAKGRYRNESFPTGVEQLLRAYALEASKANGYPLPAVCMWAITLQPSAGDDGKAAYVSVGSGDNIAHMNPFAAQMHPDNLAYINARFVGNAAFAECQTKRSDIAVAWEAEWQDAAAMAAITAVSVQPIEPIGAEVDDIPF